MQERPESYDRHPWYKVYSREALEGSLRFDLNSEERGVWWDFCHMANESRNRGTIQANDETPYPHPWLAAKLNISLELLERCMQKFTVQKRVSENDHGILVLNFEYWQGLDTRTRGRPRRHPIPTEEERLQTTRDTICAEISRLYTENIGFIKPALADEIRDFCENFGGPVPWIKLAFTDALSRNKKSWHYIRTILESWEEKGGPDDTTRGQHADRRERGDEGQRPGADQQDTGWTDVGDEQEPAEAGN